MAPAQSRQLLIWSLPTLVLLFGFFWYKRKKSFFQTDPGGKHNISIKQSSDPRDKTITGVDDYSYDDDDEYSVHDLKFSSAGSTTEEGNTFVQAVKVCDLPLDSSGFYNFPHTTSTTPLQGNKQELIDVLDDLSSSEEIKIVGEVICLLDSSDSETDQSKIFEAEEIEKSIYTEDCFDPMVKKRKQSSSEGSLVEDVIASSCPTDTQESDKENKSVNSRPNTKEAVKVFHKDLEAKMTEQEIIEEQTENNTDIENKLSNMGLNTVHNVEKSERDSANHSPAEVMLGSPSMCNFSDEHSEGSSDSGKGCSDVVTPPSRTPAGGSSVAGDQMLSIYEFVLEQHIVGRLIGRHGTYLQDIRAKTNTNLFIKRHPETNKLKICAIEGTQQDIDAALAMIRQKFPLRRFPNLTLEKVTFVQPSSHCPLKPDIFQLQLVSGVNNDVLLSSLISAGHFFLQQPTHPSYPSLHKLNIMMNALYSNPEAPPLSEPIVDAICVAPTMGGWYRAQIMSIDEQNATSDVRFLDYGGYLTVNNSLLRQIRGDFLLLPFQAIECMLANVVPAGGEGAEWSEEARQVVQYLTQQQVLQAQVYDYTETGIPLVYLYSTHSSQNGLELVLINQDLVARGYAEMIVPSPVDVDVQ